MWARPVTDGLRFEHEGWRRCGRRCERRCNGGVKEVERSVNEAAPQADGLTGGVEEV